MDGQRTERERERKEDDEKALYILGMCTIKLCFHGFLYHSLFRCFFLAFSSSSHPITSRLILCIVQPRKKQHVILSLWMDCLLFLSQNDWRICWECDSSRTLAVNMQRILASDKIPWLNHSSSNGSVEVSVQGHDSHHRLFRSGLRILPSPQTDE